MGRHNSKSTYLLSTLRSSYRTVKFLCSPVPRIPTLNFCYVKLKHLHVRRPLPASPLPAAVRVLIHVAGVRSRSTTMRQRTAQTKVEHGRRRYRTRLTSDRNRTAE